VRHPVRLTTWIFFLRDPFPKCRHLTGEEVTPPRAEWTMISMASRDRGLPRHQDHRKRSQTNATEPAVTIFFMRILFLERDVFLYGIVLLTRVLGVTKNYFACCFRISAQRSVLKIPHGRVGQGSPRPSRESSSRLHLSSTTSSDGSDIRGRTWSLSPGCDLREKSFFPWIPRDRKACVVSTRLFDIETICQSAH